MVRPVADRLQPLPSLARGGCLGRRLGRAAGRRRARRDPGRYPGHHRRHQRPGAPTSGGREKGGAAAELGRSRGGWGSKLHLISERRGRPIVAALTEGQRHESPQAIPLLERMAHRMWPDALAGDKGYSSAELRNWLLHRDIQAVIPYRTDEMGPHEYDRDLYRERPIIE